MVASCKFCLSWPAATHWSDWWEGAHSNWNAQCPHCTVQRKQRNVQGKTFAPAKIPHKTTCTTASTERPQKQKIFPFLVCCDFLLKRKSTLGLPNPRPVSFHQKISLWDNLHEPCFLGRGWSTWNDEWCEMVPKHSGPINNATQRPAFNHKIANGNATRIIWNCVLCFFWKQVSISGWLGMFQTLPWIQHTVHTRNQ